MWSAKGCGVTGSAGAVALATAGAELASSGPWPLDEGPSRRHPAGPSRYGEDPPGMAAASRPGRRPREGSAREVARPRAAGVAAVVGGRGREACQASAAEE